MGERALVTNFSSGMTLGSGGERYPVNCVCVMRQVVIVKLSGFEADCLHFLPVSLPAVTCRRIFIMKSYTHPITSHARLTKQPNRKIPQSYIQTP